MKTTEILVLIFVLIYPTLILLSAFNLWIGDLYLHAELLFIVWPAILTVLFLGSVLDEIVESPHIIIVSQRNLWRYVA